METKLQQFLSLVNKNHTELQMDRFITVKSGGTAYGCLFQCLRELSSRFDAITSTAYEMASLKIRLTRVRAKLTNSLGDEYKTSLINLKALSLETSLKTSLHRISEMKREFLRFYSQAISLWNCLGFDKEHPTESRLTQLEMERWEYRIKADAAVSIVNTGTVSGTVISMIQCLPNGMRKKLLAACFSQDSSEEARRNKAAELVNWYMSYQFELPETLALSAEEEAEVLTCCENLDLTKLLQNFNPTLLENKQ